MSHHQDFFFFFFSVKICDREMTTPTYHITISISMFFCTVYFYFQYFKFLISLVYLNWSTIFNARLLLVTLSYYFNSKDEKELNTSSAVAVISERTSEVRQSQSIGVDVTQEHAAEQRCSPPPPSSFTVILGIKRNDAKINFITVLSFEIKEPYCKVTLLIRHHIQF